MKLKSVLKQAIRQYHRARLGAVGESSDISLTADLRGDRRKNFIGRNSTICKYSSLEVDTVDHSKSQIINRREYADQLLCDFTNLRRDY